MLRKWILWLLCGAMLGSFALADDAANPELPEPEVIALHTTILDLFYDADADVFRPDTFSWNADRETCVAAMPHNEVLTDTTDSFHNARVLTAEDGRISYRPLVQYVLTDTPWTYSVDYEFAPEDAGLMRATFTVDFTADEAQAAAEALTAITTQLVDTLGEPDFRSPTALMEYTDVDVTTVHSRLAWYRGDTFFNISANYLEDFGQFSVYLGTGLRQYNVAFAEKAE